MNTKYKKKYYLVDSSDGTVCGTGNSELSAIKNACKFLVDDYGEQLALNDVIIMLNDSVLYFI